MVQLGLEVKKPEEKRVCVAVSGEISAETAGQFSEKLLEVLAEKPHVVEIDLREVPYMASPGIGALVSLLRKMNQSGGTLLLRCPSEEIQELFRVTHLDRVFTFSEASPCGRERS